MMNPVGFISYAWTGPEHIEWVETLAKDLTSLGVTVRLDQWNLRPGLDAAHFMESIVRDESVTHVIMVCDGKYKQLADSREAGAGTEAQIITQELYGLRENNKYVAVLREKDPSGRPLVPIFAASRIYIDFTDNAEYPARLEELVRWLYNKPLKVAPALGARPAWLDEDAATLSPTRLQVAAATHAIRKGERNRVFVLNDYLLAIGLQVSSVADHNVLSATGMSDSLAQIDSFLAKRDELLGVVAEIAIHEADDTTYQPVHDFFDRIATSCLPTGNQPYREIQFDIRRSIAYELFITSFAILTQHGRWSALSILINQDYVFARSDHGRGPSCDFTFFYHDNKMLAQRMVGGRPVSCYTPLADIVLNRRSNIVSIGDLVQADLILYLAAKFRRDTAGGFWWPQFCAKNGFNAIDFPVFMRSRSASYFENIERLFNVSNPADFRDGVGRIDAAGGPFRNFPFLIVNDIGTAIRVDAIGQNP